MNKGIRCQICIIALLLASGYATGNGFELGNGLNGSEGLTIPAVRGDGPKHSITVEDMLSIRRIDTLRVSPDRLHFAIFVRQSDVQKNGFRSAWYCGDVLDGRLTRMGDGGDLALRIEPNGSSTGPIQPHTARWSPDGQWVAFTLRTNSEVQLWRSKCNGTGREQLTHNESDISEFAWRPDSKAIYFTAGTSRSELRAREEARARRGYRLDDELLSFLDFMSPHLPNPPEEERQVWEVTLDDKQERKGGEDERVKFEHAKNQDDAGTETVEAAIDNAAITPIARADGGRAWLERLDSNGFELKVMASLPPNDTPLACEAPECSGSIKAVWWAEDGQRVLFWKAEGIADAQHGFYSWSPSTRKVRTAARFIDDHFDNCEKAKADRLICVRETPTRPVHVVALSLRDGTVRVLADVNPEFSSIRLGKVQRFEWTLPKYQWSERGGALEGVYPDKAFGYVLYPPDFSPAKKYPVFIEPYAAFGFDRLLHSEHALHVYAANGFIVLKTQFPFPTTAGLTRLGADVMKKLYSADLGFPHLTLLADSTLKALDTIGQQGSIDMSRVGIGGISHGSFVPLYMMQRYDRIAAISLSSAGFDGFAQYYGPTRRSRSLRGFDDWEPKPEGAGQAFWQQLQAADHVEDLEAPILMNVNATETLYLIRLIRALDDAAKPYEVYIFPGETHIKWQPAHLAAIMNRNLDWFRFWLQGYEDPDPGKRDQYERWRALKRRYERNPTPRVQSSD